METMCGHKEKESRVSGETTNITEGVALDRDVIFHNLNIPTRRHLDFLQFLDEKCSSLKIGYAIAGSIVNGKASTYSDIDVLLFMSETNNIDSIIEFEKPLMVNITERPKGIVMITYAKGLCIELDCRDYIIKEEMDKIVIINNTNMKIEDRMVVRKTITSQYAYKMSYSMDLRLLYKSLLKYLCMKEEDSINLLNEFEDKVGKSITGDKYYKKAEYLYNMFKCDNKIENHLDKEISELIDKTRHIATRQFNMDG
jgi:hypothetical protein